MARVKTKCLSGSDAAESYALLRAFGESKGVSLSNRDLLIGAHAAAVNATLITNDSAFKHFEKWLAIDHWLNRFRADVRQL
ncbi:MAG: hypothetical protein KTR35_14655 [Gammaproteobacteria bacterium]|nr:hypothetical protein [Gammaproteobacteria bacterium]